MKFLPFESVTYSTSLSEDEVLRRLLDNLEPKQIRLTKPKGHKNF